MSLIQDALRRKAAERDGTRPMEEALPAAPAAPTVTTVRVEERDTPVVRGIRAACYLVLALGALAGLVALYRSVRAERPSTRVVVVEQDAAPVAEPAPVPKAAAPKAATEPKTVPPPEPAAAAWPKLQVMGVFARPDPALSSAVIDGSLEEAGSRIRGVELREVRQNGVIFVFRGEERFVRVGKSTEP